MYKKSKYLIDINEVLGYDTKTHSPIYGGVCVYYDALTSEFIPAFDINKLDNITTRKYLKENYILEEDLDFDINFDSHYLDNVELYFELTEHCNFRCPGCAAGMDRYVPGSAKTLNPIAIKKILDKVISSCIDKGVKTLTLKWAGGEPMLPGSFKLILDIQPYLTTIKKTIALEIEQVILTNGSFLTSESILYLKNIDNVHVSVSLWGVGKINDKERKPQGKLGSFDSIVNGIKLLHENDISYNINHVVTPSNCEHFAFFIEYFWDIASENFIGKSWAYSDSVKYPIPVGINFFRPQTFEQLQKIKDNGDYIKVVKGLRTGFGKILELVRKKVPVQSLFDIDYLNFSNIMPSTCGSGFNYIAVGPNGFTNCHENLYGLESNLESVLNSNENIIEYVNKPLKKHQEQLFAVNQDFKDMPEDLKLLLSFHGGAGCPKTSFAENGKLGHAASTAYELYAPIVKELIYLEYLRRQI